MLPSLDTLLSPGPELSAFLDVLLELTPPTSERLTAELRALYAADGTGQRRPSSHAELLRDGELLVDDWEGPEAKVGFVEGHRTFWPWALVGQLAQAIAQDGAAVCRALISHRCALSSLCAPLMRRR